MTAHEHRWRLALHLDGCHDWTSGYACDCGATRTIWQERKLSEPGFWEPLDDCERCQQLANGKRRRPRRDRIEVPA